MTNFPGGVAPGGSGQEYVYNKPVEEKKVEEGEGKRKYKKIRSEKQPIHDVEKKVIGKKEPVTNTSLSDKSIAPQQQISSLEHRVKRKEATVFGFDKQQYAIKEEENLERQPIGAWVVRKSTRDPSQSVLAIKMENGPNGIARMQLGRTYDTLSFEDKKKLVDEQYSKVMAYQLKEINELKKEDKGAWIVHEAEMDAVYLYVNVHPEDPDGVRFYGIDPQYANLNFEEKKREVAQAYHKITENLENQSIGSWVVRKSTDYPDQSVLAIKVGDGPNGIIRIPLGTYEALPSDDKKKIVDKYYATIMAYLPKEAENLENQPVGSWVVRKSSSDPNLCTLAVKTEAGIVRTRLANYYKLPFDEKKNFVDVNRSHIMQNQKKDSYLLFILAKLLGVLQGVVA